MTKIFYLGPNGSYSNIVAKKVLEKTDYELIPCNSFLDIVNNTICSINTIGILPIENSITSDIHENIDYLFQNNLSIIYEAFLRINLHVIGLKNTTISDIKNVYSHPRALAQCTKFTSQHHVKTFETISTSAAKEFILQNKEKANAIIGSRELLSDHQLSLIQENIGNDQYNLTRFVFVSIDKTRNISAVKNKT